MKEEGLIYKSVASDCRTFVQGLTVEPVLATT